MDYLGNQSSGVYTSPQMSGYLLGVDAVREFNVLGHTYGAEYGKRAGAQVSIVTTSGTNQWRGSAFEYLRNSALDTRNFFDVKDAPLPTPVAPFKRNQFGGSLGGPILRDKMFAFGNYEGFRERLAVSQFGYVPSLQVRQGLWPNASGVYERAPNLAPGMLPFFRYWPEPNGPELLRNGLPTGTAQYSGNPTRAVQEDFGLARYDYNMSSADSLSTNFTVDKGHRLNPVDPTFLQDQHTNLYTLGAQETHIFSPTMLNTATFGYSSARADTKAPPFEPFPEGLLFLKGGKQNNPGAVIIGGGTATVGASALIAPNGQNLSYNARRNYSVADDLRLTKGRHNLSLGVWFQRVEQTAFSAGQVNAGTVTYPTLLAFLQDRPTRFSARVKPTELNFRSTEAAWYFQDEIKLRSNLTLRLGLRDEMTTGWNEKNGHAANYIFDQNGVMVTNPLIGKSALVENNGVRSSGNGVHPVGGGCSELASEPLLSSYLGWFFFGTSSYHAMNLSLTKRARSGLTFKSNYTWGKALDINSAILPGQADNEPAVSLNRFNRKLDKGVASFSILHQFSTNFSYQLPFGPGKAFGSGASGWVEKLIGGWTYGIFSAQSGFPITPLVGSNRSGNGDARNPDVPNLNPNFQGKAILGVKEFKKTGRYFDPNAFSMPLAGTFGNAGRSSFRGPGLVNLDTSLFKRIPVNERLNLQFRTEFFNVLNHPNFDTPNPIVFSGNNISPTAGVLTGTVASGNGRQIQFALRLEF